MYFTCILASRHLAMCFVRPITKTRLFKCIEIFTTTNWKFSDKNSDIFHMCSKHRLWVLVRTASPQSMLLSRNKKKNNVYLCTPQFYYIKVGFKGSQNYLHVASRKHAIYIFVPLKTHFYIVKLWFTGVYIIFLISVHKHRLWVFVRTASARRF